MTGNTRISTAIAKVKARAQHAEKKKQETDNENEKKYQDLQIAKYRDCLHWLDWLINQ